MRVSLDEHGREVGMVRWIALGLLALGFAPAFGLAADLDKDALAKARKLGQTGKYAEAVDAYEALTKDATSDDDKLKIAIGKADNLAATGELDKAAEALKPFAEGDTPKPAAAARLASLEFDRGRWDRAEALANAALKVDKEHIPARWVAANLLDAQGKRKEADAAYKWFIDTHNARKRELSRDAEALLMIGQAAERYYRRNARGEDLKETLEEVITELYEGALRTDPTCWRAPLLEGRVFLAGYNEGAAMKELVRAQRMNPSAPELLVTLGQADLQGYKLASGRKRADAALEINPHYGPAHVLLADLNISDEKFKDALENAKKAVQENPRDEEALGRLAACYRLLVDPAGASAVEAVAIASNSKPATFFAALGERLSDRRKYHSAERAFLKSIAADPDRADTRIGLGMLYMQIGREDEANDLFTTAFASDPFNVRADNMRKVLKHLASYTPVDSAHYQVLVLPGQDAILGKYMSRYLEEIHDEAAKRLGFQLPAKTKIEIMKDHTWFSGRTTGLPFIPTVGACTGKIIAMASPRAMPKPYNWARVITHEMTHVINLQQTDFNIPHWYTECLAVESEKSPRPQEWNKLLMDRVPTRKKLHNLDSINLGFIRPKEAEDRSMAYCQAQLYGQYMVKRFGEDAHVKMLGAYRRGLTTDQAIKDSFKVEKDDFEKGYLEHLDAVVKTIRARVENEEPVKFSKLQQMLKDKPEDADLNARMAYEHFSRRELREARPYADKALELKPNQPLAAYVKARLLQSIGDNSAALKVLEPALDLANPNERVIDLLAELQMKAGELEEAEKLYEAARKDDPQQTKWIAGLARVHLRQGDKAKLLGDLAMIADNDADDLDVRKKLAEYHAAAGNVNEAEKWAWECLYVQVYDPANHLIMGDALSAQGKFPGAAEEYQMALDLKAKKPNDVKVKLARAQWSAGKDDDAKTTLDAVLKADPEHPEAMALRDEMKKAK
jgi:cellulose synthase operon protein C